MSVRERVSPGAGPAGPGDVLDDFRIRRGRALGRAYFAVQACGGAVWWLGVFLSDRVRAATLGALNPLLVALGDIPLFVVASVLVALGVRAAAWVAVPWTILVTLGMGVYATVAGLAGWGALIMVAASAGSFCAWMLVVYGRVPAERLLIGPVSFRTSPPGSRRQYLGRTLLQLIFFWVMFLAGIPLVILGIEERWQLRLAMPDAVMNVGMVLLISASLLGLWSAHTMASSGEGTPLPAAMARKLVVTGPYRFVRNPMAIAGVAQAIGVGFIAGSWLVVCYALCGAIYWNWLVRPLEEADLEARHGAEFVAYRVRTRCWIPRLGRDAARPALRSEIGGGQ